MNIAFSGLILLLLFLPGIIFRVTLIKSDSFENPLDTSRIAEVIFVLFPSLILHSIGYIFLENYLNKNVRLDQLYYLISGNSISIQKLEFNQIIEPSFLNFLLYVLCLCMIGGIVGWFLKQLIIKIYWDLKFTSLFGITNEWYNLLSGRSYCYQRKNEIRGERWSFIKNKHFYIIFSKNNRKRFCVYRRQLKNVRVDFIDLDVLVSVGSSNYIYKGMLSDYFLAKGNSIDKIYLIHPLKKRIDIENEDDFEVIKSDTIVIKNENIINLNVRVGLIE